jgi:hypothetical protein
MKGGCKMIHILNDEYFKFDYDKSGKIINVFTEPQNIELDLYSKKPFAIVGSELFTNNIKTDRDIMKYNNKSVAIQKNNGLFNLPNIESANLLNEVDIKLPFVFYAGSGNNIVNKANIALVAIPIMGIIQPIADTNNSYTLYNGYILKTHPFTKGFSEYRKILYLAFELRTQLTFAEYIQPFLVSEKVFNIPHSDNDEEYGICLTHTVGLGQDENDIKKYSEKEVGWCICDNLTVSYIPYNDNMALFRSDARRDLFPSIVSRNKTKSDTKQKAIKPVNHTIKASSRIEPDLRP